MKLRIRCKCGRVLGVPSNMAGRKLTCPQCEKPFRIPAEQFAAAARKVASANAVGGGASEGGSSATVRRAVTAPVPAVRNVKEIPEPVALDVEPVDLDVDAPMPPPGVPSVVVVETDVHLDYAAGEDAGQTALHTAERDPIRPPEHGYWADALSAFIYPAWSVGNAANFAFIAIFIGLAIPIGLIPLFGPFLGLIWQVFLFGWLASVYLSVVQDTASGSRDMPGIRMADGFFEDIAKPAFKFIGSFAVAFFPAIVYGLLIAFGVSLPGALLPVPLVLGVFFWPLIMLMFAFGALHTLTRIDLLVRTILRSFLPYVATWLMLLIVAGLMLTTTGALGLLGLTLTSLETLMAAVGVQLVLEIFQTYLMLVAMRMIGLYYLHFRTRFAFRME